MALTYIWSGFFIVAFLAALGQWLFLGNVDIFKKMVDGTFESARFAVMDIALPLAGVMTLWMGILAIGEKAGAIDAVARIIGPFFSRIFPGVPREHPATGLMVMNYSANFLGLDNAATPIGLKAMESLQTLNPRKDEATDAQIMFLVLNTAGMTLIPVSVMAQRAILGAQDAADIFIPTLIATFAGSLVALIAVALKQRISLADPVVIAWLGGITAFMAAMVWYFTSYLTKEEIQLVSKLAGNILILTVIVGFICGALYRGVNVYEVFIEGAKGGIHTSIMIIPFLVGMLVAIGVLRNSGVLDMMVGAIAWGLGMMGLNADFTPSLPTALMKSISGSGARAMAIEVMKTYGVDSFVGRLVSIIQGSSDTTFYIVALYFGAVGITKTRYSIAYGLLADLAAVVAAIWVAYLFFH
ncbi:MAG TPA: nucleoside recognition domain-containing protein [Usitatibacter sp.]|nr:nucleoside recognition domain-containing protein [Usitatibacter sp.]